jgi:hypothetical protein
LLLEGVLPEERDGLLLLEVLALLGLLLLEELAMLLELREGVLALLEGLLELLRLAVPEDRVGLLALCVRVGELDFGRLVTPERLGLVLLGLEADCLLGLVDFGLVVEGRVAV